MNKKLRIMIVEDEGIVSIDIRMILQNLGYEVAASAYSGTEAVQKAESAQLDLILMDIGLKGDMDGIEASRIIKDRFQIPIIFFSGFADEKTYERAKKIEPYGYILKPVREEDIKDAIRNFLSALEKE